MPIAGNNNEMQIQMLRSKAQQVYEYMVTASESDWQRNMYNWDWKPGVGLMAAWSYYQAVKQPHIKDYLWRWMRDNKHKAAQLRVINSTAPYAALTELLREEPSAEWLRLATEHGNWLMLEAPRTAKGGFEHTVTEGDTFAEQVWADTIVVGALYLARLASLIGNRQMAQEAIDQVAVHLRLLQDAATGVLYHGYDGQRDNHMSAAFWGRANAWVTFGVPEIVAEVRELVDIPDEIEERYVRLVQGLIRLQTANGMWHTVMNRPDFYLETSATAGIAYGFLVALRQGLVKDEDLRQSMKESTRRSLHAVMIHVDVYGAVQGVSGGTPVMPSVEAYNDVIITPTPYGQALALMLFSELLRYSPY